MADVFISYKSEDRTAAKLFAEALMAEGVSVWWDPVLRTGETYDEVIERNLREAALVVVLWSPRSVKSKWVRAEATIGERKGGLLPVLIEACDRPIAFELVQTANLAGWAGGRDDARWADFMADLRAALSTRAAAVGAHTAPPPPDPLTIETLFWSSIKDGGDTADYESYLQRYPHGQFAELARARLARSAHEPVAARGALFDPGRYVFVSYPTDIAPALLLSVVRELLRRGLSIWLYDPSAYAFTPEEKARLRWQQAGGSWEQQTLDAIRNASAVIALVNEYSLQSRFQPREFKVAAQEKKLLPCIISDLNHKNLPPLFRDVHAAKITADMLDSDVGRNRVAMLASDAEALIERSRSGRAAGAPARGQEAPGRGLNWAPLTALTVVAFGWTLAVFTTGWLDRMVYEATRPMSWGLALVAGVLAPARRLWIAVLVAWTFVGAQNLALRGFDWSQLVTPNFWDSGAMSLMGLIPISTIAYAAKFDLRNGGKHNPIWLAFLGASAIAVGWYCWFVLGWGFTGLFPLPLFAMLGAWLRRDVGGRGIAMAVVAGVIAGWPVYGLLTSSFGGTQEMAQHTTGPLAGVVSFAIAFLTASLIAMTRKRSAG